MNGFSIGVISSGSTNGGLKSLNLDYTNVLPLCANQTLMTSALAGFITFVNAKNTANDTNNIEWLLTFRQDEAQSLKVVVDLSHVDAGESSDRLNVTVEEVSSIGKPENYGFEFLYTDPYLCGSVSFGSKSRTHIVHLEADPNGNAVNKGSFKLKLNQLRTPCLPL